MVTYPSTSGVFEEEIRYAKEVDMSTNLQLISFFDTKEPNNHKIVCVVLFPILMLIWTLDNVRFIRALYRRTCNLKITNFFVNSLWIFSKNYLGQYNSSSAVKKTQCKRFSNNCRREYYLENKWINSRSLTFSTLLLMCKHYQFKKCNINFLFSC